MPPLKKRNPNDSDHATSSAHEEEQHLQKLNTCATSGCKRQRQYAAGFVWDRCCKLGFITECKSHDALCDQALLQQRMTPAAAVTLLSSAAASWEQPKTNEDSRSFVDGSTEDFRTKTDAFFALLQQKNISDAILRDAIVDFLARWEGKHKATYRELLADSAVAQEANKLLPKDLPLWLWIRRCLHGEIELIERIDLIEEEKCEWLIR